MQGGSIGATNLGYASLDPSTIGCAVTTNNALEGNCAYGFLAVPDSSVTPPPPPPPPPGEVPEPTTLTLFGLGLLGLGLLARRRNGAGA